MMPATEVRPPDVEQVAIIAALGQAIGTCAAAYGNRVPADVRSALVDTIRELRTVMDQMANRAVVYKGNVPRHPPLSADDITQELFRIGLSRKEAEGIAERFVRKGWAA